MSFSRSPELLRGVIIQGIQEEATVKTHVRASKMSPCPGGYQFALSEVAS